MARLAIVASCTPATGNLHTALRLRSLLQRLKHTVQLLDCHSPHLHRELQASDAELFIAVHALRSGLPCLRAGVRYLLLCGGTDVNVHASEPARRQRLCAVVAGAVRVLVFTAAMEARLAAALALAAGEKEEGSAAVPAPIVLPQAVDVSEAAPPDSVPCLRSLCGVPADMPLALLPAGIRPVKDVSFAVAAFQTANATALRAALVVVGPHLDPGELARLDSFLPGLQNAATAQTGSDEALAAQAEVTPLASCKGVFILPPVGRPTLLGWMQQATAVLNSSVAEGMPNAVLEAMALGTPVVARRNEGTVALLQALAAGAAEGSGCCRGVLVDRGEAMVQAVQDAGAAGEAVQAMVQAGKAAVAECFSAAAEQAAWAGILESALSPTPAAAAGGAAQLPAAEDDARQKYTPL